METTDLKGQYCGLKFCETCRRIFWVNKLAVDCQDHACRGRLYAVNFKLEGWENFDKKASLPPR